MPFRSIFDGRLVPGGENPNGVRQVTPAGVATDDNGTGVPHDYPWGPPLNGPRWAMPQPDLGETFGAVPTPVAVLLPKLGKPRSGK
jgi:hypothetical protein